MGEIKLIFRTADRNRDNQVSFAEWNDFHKLFVAPFEEIDQRGEYWLDAGDVALALSEDQDWFNGIKHFVPEDEQALLIEQFDRFNQEQNLNFADYLFLRKCNLAFKECASEGVIGAKQMGCALQITSPGRLLQSPEAHEIYSLANLIRDGNKRGSQSRINFIEFLGIAHLYYYFSEFELPFKFPHINKKDILRAIDEAVLPTTMNPTNVEEIFQYDLAEMDFKGFGGSLYAYRLYKRNTFDGETVFDLGQFNSMLELPKFNPLLLELIDELYTPT